MSGKIYMGWVLGFWKFYNGSELSDKKFGQIRKRLYIEFTKIMKMGKIKLIK